MVARRVTSSWPASVAMAAASRWSAAVAVTAGDASPHPFRRRQRRTIRCWRRRLTRMGPCTASTTTAIGCPDAWFALLGDVAVLVVFVLVGRRSHHEDAGFAGFLRVWWPFAVALGVAWLATGLWRAPLAWRSRRRGVAAHRRARHGAAHRGAGSRVQGRVHDRDVALRRRRDARLAGGRPLAPSRSHTPRRSNESSADSSRRI